MDIRIRLKTYYPAGYPTGKPDRDHLWLIGISEFRSFACDIHRSDLLLLSAIYRWPFYSHVAPSPGRQKADLELFINPTTLNWGLPTPRYGSPRCTFPLLGKVHAFGLKPPRFVVDVCDFVAYTRWYSSDVARLVHVFSTCFQSDDGTVWKRRIASWKRRILLCYNAAVA